VDQFQTSEGRAGKGRIKAEKTSDDVERKGTPEIGRRKKKKIMLLLVLLRGPKIQYFISLSLFVFP